MGRGRNPPLAAGASLSALFEVRIGCQVSRAGCPSVMSDCAAWTRSWYTVGSVLGGLWCQGTVQGRQELLPDLDLSLQRSQAFSKRHVSWTFPGQESFAAMSPLAPPSFSVQLHLAETNEIFSLPRCQSDLTLKKLKSHLELLTGIPLHLQRLQYLDEGENL